MNSFVEKRIIRIENEIVVDNFKLTEAEGLTLEFSNCIFSEGIQLQGCDFKRITFKECLVEGDIVLNGCSFQFLDIRLKNPSDIRNSCSLSLTQSVGRRLITWNVGSANIQYTTLTEFVELNNIVNCSVSFSKMASISVSNLACSEDLLFKCSKTRIDDDLIFDCIVNLQLIVSNSRISELAIKSSTVNCLEMTQCQVYGTCHISFGNCLADQIKFSGCLIGSLIVDNFNQSKQDLVVVLSDASKVISDVRLNSVCLKIFVSAVCGIVTRRDSSSIVELCPDSAVSKVSVPDARVSSVSGMSDFCSSWFGLVTDAGLATLFRSFEDRPNEQDLVYYLIQSPQSVGNINGVFRLMFGWLTGWGVLFSRPFYVFIITFLSSILVPFVFITDLGLFESFVSVFGMWFAFGTWRYEQFDNSLYWSLFSLFFGLCGLYFTTILSGIGIRKLVR